MKRIIGYFTLLAAIVLIGCSAVTLFHTAFDSAVGVWQQWTQGAQIVSAIIWEAGAVIAITYCARHRHFIMALAGSVLLVLAMGYTLSQELRQQAGAQESAATVRAAKKGKLELVRGELDKAIALRDSLQKLRKLTEEQREELADARSRISKLTDKWEAQIDDTPASTAPGVALIARWTGLNLNDSADLDPLIKMAFWTMARVFALPLAVFGITLLGASTLPSQRREGVAIQTSPVVQGSAVTMRPRAPLVPREDVLALMAQTQMPPYEFQEAANTSGTITAASDTSPTPSDTNPGPSGGTKAVDVCPDEHTEMFDETNTFEPKVVNTDGSPYEGKPGKRRRDEALHDNAVKRFFSEVYETAPIEVTGKGGWKAGGTPASAVRKDYEAFCLAHKLPILRGSHFGRFAAAHVDVAPSATGRIYGCRKLEVKINRRKVA